VLDPEPLRGKVASVVLADIAFDAAEEAATNLERDGYEAYAW
jgi:hypothetical protein